jgi:voltage-gated potassium channel
MASPKPSDTGRQAPYLIFILLASVIALVLLGVEAFGQPDKDTRVVLSYADLFLCGLFFSDFVLSLYRAENKLHYMLTWGWLDLISSIPAIDALRWGRAARLVRILRLLRGVRSARMLTQFLVRHRVQSGAMGGAMGGALLVLVVITFGSVCILHAEREQEGANIHSAEDALWWAVTTMTTVGYGDKFPVSTEGRAVAAILMITGVGLFGSLSGLVAATLLSPAEARRDDEVALLRAEVRELRELIERRMDGEVRKDAE